MYAIIRIHWSLRNPIERSEGNLDTPSESFRTKFLSILQQFNQNFILRCKARILIHFSNGIWYKLDLLNGVTATIPVHCVRDDTIDQSKGKSDGFVAINKFNRSLKRIDHSTVSITSCLDQ